MSYQITVTESAPHTVLKLHRQVRAEHTGEDLADGMRELFDQARSAKLWPVGPPATTYFDALEPGKAVNVEFTVPIGHAPPGSNAPTVEVATQPPRLVAHTRHRGDYRGIASAYQAIDDWIRSSRYRAAGPPTEIYLVGPDTTTDPRELLTEIRIPVTPALSLAVRLDVPFAEAVARTRRALGDQGFGVLTEIDVRATLQEKLGVEFEDYLILGACNPPLAHRALRIDRQLGLLMPCNVVIRGDNGHILVEATDPDVLVRVTEQPALRPIATEMRSKLAAALYALRAEPAGAR